MMDAPRYIVRLADGQTFGPAFEVMLVRWAGERRIPPEAEIVPVNAEGQPTGAAVTARDFGPIRAIVMHAMQTAPAANPPEDIFSRMIPSRNTPALIGYYAAVVGLIPCIGLPSAMAALVLGIIGIRKWQKDPSVRGRTHAIVAIVGGSVELLLYGGLLLLFVLAAPV